MRSYRTAYATLEFTTSPRKYHTMASPTSYELQGPRLLFAIFVTSNPHVNRSSPSKNHTSSRHMETGISFYSADLLYNPGAIIASSHCHRQQLSYLKSRRQRSLAAEEAGFTCM